MKQQKTLYSCINVEENAFKRLKTKENAYKRDTTLRYFDI